MEKDPNAYEQASDQCLEPINRERSARRPIGEEPTKGWDGVNAEGSDERAETHQSEKCVLKR